MSCEQAIILTNDAESQDDTCDHEAANHAKVSCKRAIGSRWIVVGIGLLLVASVAIANVAWSTRGTARAALVAGEDESIELDEAATGTAIRDFKEITCPVLGALFKNGDLVPDEDGKIEKQQTIDAMLRIGISSAVANGASNGNFDHLTMEPKILHLFGMDLNREVEPDEAKRSKEHDFSTGIRDGVEPSVEKYKEFRAFIGTDGDTGSWSSTDVDAAILHFGNVENSNDVGENANGLNTINFMLSEFGDADGKLSKLEMKQLFLYSTYPDHFKESRETAIQNWEEEHGTTTAIPV